MCILSIVTSLSQFARMALLVALFQKFKDLVPTFSATCMSASSTDVRSAFEMMRRHRRMLCTLLLECCKERNSKKRGTNPSLQNISCSNVLQHAIDVWTERIAGS